jgi:hypothetical protein
MTSPRLVGFEPQMAAVQGARTYATSRRHGIRLGDVIGEAPSAIALANEAEMSRVRKRSRRRQAARRLAAYIHPTSTSCRANGQR